MKLVTYLALIAMTLQFAKSKPFGNFIGDLLAGKIKIVSPAEYFAPSENPPAPSYSAPKTTTTTTTTTTAVPKRLFEPSYNPPAPSYDVPPAPKQYEVPVPPEGYEAPAPFKASYQLPEEAPLLSDSYEVPSHPSFSYQEPTKDRNGVAFQEAGGWRRSSPTGHSYLVSNDSMTWRAALEFCQGYGGFLAELRTAEQHLELGDLLENSKNDMNKLWIGLQQPFSRWEASRDLVTWSNWRIQRQPDKDGHCAALKVKNLRWVAKDCTNNHGFKALCQKVPQVEEFKVQEFNAESGSNHCIVKGVQLDLTNYLDKIENIESSADCHNICLKTVNCNFWSWDSSWKQCYLQQTDNKVVRDDYSESGTVLASRGCNQEIRSEPSRQSRVETCSCEPRIFTPGSFDARSLPFNEDDKQPDHLGKLIQHSACRPGFSLVCTDDDQIIDVKEINYKPNITDCIVYDVRLSAQDAMLTLYDVSNAETCHAFCLATDQCAYWTWRGDFPDKACFLLRAETSMQRRVGSAAGTVLEKYGCRMNVITELLNREPKEIDENYDYVDANGCSCELAKEDLLEGKLDPAYFGGDGRIVNEARVGGECPYGYSTVCKSPTAYLPNENTGKVQYSATPTKLKVQYSAKPTSQKQPREISTNEKQVYQVKEWNTPLYKHLSLESLYGRSLKAGQIEAVSEDTSTTQDSIKDNEEPKLKEASASEESKSSSRIRFEE